MTGSAVDSVVAAAAEVASEWAAAPRSRASALTAVAAALEEHREELVGLADAEAHLGPVRLNGELTRTTFQLKLFAELVAEGRYLDVRIDRPVPDWPSGPRPDLRRYRTALGPVLVFAASNFPFAFSVAGGDTASAWAAGCPVVVKAHPGHPRLSRRTAEVITTALQDAGAPDGVFALIEGEDAGVEALRHPRLAAAAFTGSQRGGLALAKIAAERPVPIPFYGELGSVNPVVVTPAAAKARTDEIADGYTGSVTQGAGQFCTNPGLAFLPADGDLLDAIARRMDAASAAPMLNDRIAGGFADSSAALAGRPGARAVVWPDDPTAPRLLAMDLAAFTADVEAASEECFGPLGLAVLYERIEDVADALAALPGQLTASLHAEAKEAASLGALTAALADRAGRVLWNQWPTGVSVTHAMQHGGPFPATVGPASTSVGTAAVERFLRPVAYQNCPQELLPPPLRDDNPWNVPQTIT